MTFSRKPLHDFMMTFQERLGFSHCGLTTLQMPVSFEAYQEWIDRGYHGEMAYLKRHLPAKKEVKSHYPFAESALVFAFPYMPWPSEVSSQKTSLRTALYSRGADYHDWIAQKLNVLVTELRVRYPEHEFLIATDSKPLLERDLAYRAGLGWVGKNTCLIDRQKGSLFFLAEILSSLQIEEAPQGQFVHDFCGTCNRCQVVCPTQAIESPKVVNATKCISYWTIEAKTVPPAELRGQIGDWFFGCDLCQTVCPWNQKIFGSLLETQKILSKTLEEEAHLEEELRDVLSLSHGQLEKKFQGTALSRARGFGLKRNALIVIANRQIKTLKADVEDVMQNTSNAELKDLAVWCLEQLR